MAVSTSLMNKYLLFKKNLKEFPCSFNVGTANLKVGNKEFHSEGFQEPHLQKDIWSYLKNNLEEDVDELDPELVDPTWKDNLRVRVYAELGEFDKAWELSKKILERSPENLVALANSGFLSLLRFYLDDANNTLGILEALRNNEEVSNTLGESDDLTTRKRFDIMKLEAVCEQGYTYYKFSEGDNKTMIETTVEILEYCVENIKENVGNNAGYCKETEKLELMLATMYRRNGNPAFVKNIKKFVEKAVNLFTILKENTKSVSIKSICTVELARLKKNAADNEVKVVNELNNSIIDAVRNHQSVRLLTSAGPMFNTYPDESEVNKLLEEIIRKERRSPLAQQSALAQPAPKGPSVRQARSHHQAAPDQRPLTPYVNVTLLAAHAHNFLGGLHFKQAKKLKYPILKHLNNFNTDLKNDDLVALLLSVANKIPEYSDQNPFIGKFIENFEQFYNSPHYDGKAMCIGAFRLFQARRYDFAMEVCEKVLSRARSQGTYFHIDAHYMLALCSAMKFVEPVNHEMKLNIKDKCLYHVISCLRYAAILVAEKEEINIIDHTFLWKGFLEIPDSVSYHIMDFRMNAFERLQKLVSFFRQAVPELERIIQKTEKDWNDIANIEQELEELKNTKLNLALLYLSLINLRPETRQRISWRNSHVVRAIKLEEAKDIFTQGKLGVCHDGIWEECFNV